MKTPSMVGSIRFVLLYRQSDPVAYRIEPLLLAQGSEDIPDPMYLTREGEGVRLHVKAMQLGDEVRRSILDKGNVLSSFMSGITSQAQALLQAAEDQNHDEDKAMKEASSSFEGPLRFYLAGRNDRLDFQLQPRVIDNDYVSAVLAHSSYFSNKDVTDYIIDLTRAKVVDEVIDLTGDDMDSEAA